MEGNGVPLREHLEKQICAIRELYEQRFKALEKSIADQASSFPTKAEITLEMRSLTKDIAHLTDRASRSESTGYGMSRMWGYVAGVIGTLIGAAGLWMAFTRPWPPVG